MAEPGDAPALTHFDPAGNARMVDVGAKPETGRVAIAQARVTMLPQTLDLIDRGKAAKGDVLGVARLAGIMAAKRTAELIPLCHLLPLTGIDLRLWLDRPGSAVCIEAECKVTGRTGVEMEALTAASVAALTVYDMVKAADRGMVIGEIRLLHKEGGKTGIWSAPA